MKKQEQNSIFAQIEKEIPKILAKVSQKSSDFLTNEKSHKNAFVLGYEFLPLVIRLLISEDKFVNFCMENKEKFFGKENAAPKKTVSKKVAPTKKVPVKAIVVTAKKTVVSPKTVTKPTTKTATKTSLKPVASPKKVVASKPKTVTAKKLLPSK